MKLLTLLTMAALMIFPRCASAVGTSNWMQTTETDWKAGNFDNVVATNLGDLKLSRALQTLLEQDPDVSSVNAMVEGPDGSIYAGTGPKGVLLRIKGDDVSKIMAIDGATSILSLCMDVKGRLLIGTGGETGRILRLEHPTKEGEKTTEVFRAAGVQYVWQLCQTADGITYAATGPTGKLFEIDAGGKQKALLETEENNLTALISDGKDRLFVGTDPNGLIYRVNRKTGESFVLYDAAEAEISALALDAQGNLYAATAEAKPEPPAAPGAGGVEAGGRPEGGAAGDSITAEPPKDPAPPKLPDPNPGQPRPIPKQLPEGDTSGPRSQGRAGPSRRELRLTQLLRLANRPSDNPRSRLVRSVDSPFPEPPAGKPRPPRLPGAPGTKPTSQPVEPPGLPGHQPPVEPTAAEPRPEGNAVYKIDPEGFVTEVFRQPVLVLAMVENHGTLLIATGDEGRIYQVNPAAGETIVLAKVEPREVLSLLPASDGRIYLGLANVGGIAAMSPGFAAKGTYTSTVLDATQISRFGKIHLHGLLEPDTALTVSTRSGNVRDAAGKGWSDWTEDVPAQEFLKVQSPSARFLQYRIRLTSKDGKSTPVVEDINIAYQMPNLPPMVKSVKIMTAPDPAAQAAAAAGGGDADASARAANSHRQTIGWEASDPNSDALQFGVYFREMSSKAGGPWILLKDKLTDPVYDWDTRGVADGRYEIKVVASDAAANVVGKGLTATRVSDPVLVDNTPPVIGDLKFEQHGAEIRVSCHVVDRTGVVSSGDYSVDSSKDWQAFLPSDNIWDGPEESAEFTIGNLSAGNHQVTVRATDSSGNQAYANLRVTVQGPAASK